jgi:hypothetical protein
MNSRILHRFFHSYFSFSRVYDSGTRVWFSYFSRFSFGHKNFCIVILCLLVTSNVFAQNDSSEERKKEKQSSLLSFGLGIQYGTIFAHSEEVQNTSGARPIGIEAILGWQRNDAAAFSLCNCYPRQGLLLAYYDYDVAVLGKSGTAAYFLEPTYRISDSFLFSFKGAGGFSYLSNPYHSENNPGNQSYSRHLSAYLLVGIGAWLQISDKLWLNPSINYQHISNGGTRQPNKGINWPTAGVALSYQPESRAWYTGTRTSEKFWKDYSPRYDFALLGTMRKSYDDAGERVRYALGGIAVQGAKQVGRLSMISLGAEA